eukprot:Sro506_g156330.2  (228) ;mRNA; r:30851-31534
MLISLNKPSENINEENNCRDGSTIPSNEIAWAPSMSHVNSGGVWDGGATNAKPKVGLLEIQAQEKEAQRQKQKEMERQREEERRKAKHLHLGRHGFSNRWDQQQRFHMHTTPNHHQQPTPRYGQDQNRLIRVVGLSEETTEADLFDLCRQFGRVTRVHVAKDRETGLSRGFAFVTFGNQFEAASALDGLSGMRYNYRIIGADWARQKEPRPIRRTGYGKGLPQTTWR